MISTRNQIRAVTAGASKLKVISGNPNQAGRGNAVGRMRTPGSKVEAFYDMGSSLNGMNVTSMGQNPAFYDTLLTGLASELEPTNHRFYKDIYNYDTTAGACVDLMSSMPFSNFTLSGVEGDRLDVYNKAIDQLNLKTFFQEMTVDYLVLGFMVASLMYDSKSKTFTDIISHPPSNCELMPVPLRSRDPFIKVKQSEELKKFMTSQDPRVVKLRSKIHSSVLEGLQADEAELDPTQTLYMARRTYTHSSLGTSLYKRLLPIYFLEKTLYKGTVVEAGRRQRSLLHLGVGDDTWEPTIEELQAIVSLFQQADLDPLGAIIATRAGVAPNELRQGGDFWKWTDIIDILAPAKLRALGISESFLSGDATYNNMETGLSVFVENLQAYRERCTYTVMYNKILPLIAAVNDFRNKNQKGGGDANQTSDDKKKEESRTSSMRGAHMLKDLNNKSKWDLPEVNWQKSLGRDIDTQFMDVLDKLAEKGAPISLRMYAAAGGVDLDTLEDDLEEEKDLKAKWAKHGFKGNDQPGISGGEEDEDGEGGGAPEFSSYLGGRKRRAILGRDFGETGEIVGRSKTGEKKYIPNQRAANQEVNARILDAARKIADPHQHEMNLRRVREANGGSIPDLYHR